MQDSHKPNALVHEVSPYLLQHAYNPVHWVPWTTEAFARAKAEDKPVFVSIGYSTCHWCHVMERESFENLKIAGYLNSNFISIKVDREERPDIDAFCMDICQAMTGHGGWPLTVMMDSEMRPFFAGTYFPPVSLQGRIGFLDLLQKIHGAWTTDRIRLLKSATEAQSYLEDRANADYQGVIAPSVFSEVRRYHKMSYDEEFGGFGSRPKFPSPHHLLLLLRLSKTDGDPEFLRMVSHTLDAMRAGGIFDHLGYGFHRYSTDRAWLVPHFEKMLYDQAMLLWAYTEAWQATGIERFRETAQDIVWYVENFLKSEEGAFYSAQDADSEGVEGKYYVWTKSELSSVLGAEAVHFLQDFNITEEGNFSDELTGGKSGQNIPHLTIGEWQSRSTRITKESRVKLLELRGKRIPPLTDTKILSDWNGLIIGTIAKAGRAFASESLIVTATNAYKACIRLLKTNGDDDTFELNHRYRDGRSGISGMLDDYTMMAFAAIELYQSTANRLYLDDCLSLMRSVDSKFRSKDGSLRITTTHVQDIPLQYRSFTDGAYPSGVSMYIEVCAALLAITKESEWKRTATSTLNSYGKLIESSPVSFCMALATYSSIDKQVFSVESSRDTDSVFVRETVAQMKSEFLPGMYYLYTEKESESVLICTDTYCLETINSSDKLDKFLKEQRLR